MSNQTIEKMLEILNHSDLNPQLVEVYQESLRKYQNSPQATYLALCEVVQRKEEFNRQSIWALIRVLSFYPLGTYVQLNTDELGIVVETCPDHPMRGKVKILKGPDGWPIDEYRIVNLCRSPFLYVVKPLEDDEID